MLQHHDGHGQHQMFNPVKGDTEIAVRCMDRSLPAITDRINGLMEQKDMVIIAIDGKCTSGKTTLARQLKQIYGCNVFHMDDFFLRPEVLLPLRAGTAFSYRPFDCSTFTLSDPVPVVPKRLHIVKGTYSLHPYFGDPYDLGVLLTVTPELQHQRILEHPPFLHKRFFEEWIPMEDRYFEGFGISDNCDLLF